MTQSAPNRGAKGFVEGIKGKAKAALGALSGDRDLKDEGRAREDTGEDTGDALRETAKRETEAARAWAEAQVDEARQEGHARNARS